MFKGLSLDQAPPLEAPLRFFLTAPIFAIIAGVFIFFTQNFSIFYSLQTVAIIHLFTIGFMSMVMIGALQQMLPVLVGVRFPKPILFSKIIHISLLIAIILFFTGFYFEKNQFLLFSIPFFIISLGIFSIITLYKLFTASFSNHTVNAMRASLIFLIITLLLGFHILFSIGTSHIKESFYSFLNAHAIAAFFGWVGLLIIGVSYQVIPMFYVTKEFNANLKRILNFSILFFIIFSIFSLFIKYKYAIIFLLIAFALFGFISFYHLINRKRKISDITIKYWYLSSISLIIGTILLLLDIFYYSFNLTWISGVFLGFGFAISLINGMLYKIIPFLAWFHLSSKGFFDIPTMKEMIDDRYEKIQFLFHFIAFICLILIPFINIEKILSIFIIISNLFLFLNLLKAAKIYFEYKNRPSPIEKFNIKSS
ncbi:hypothetical protein [Nitrosophilus kaiyonis]|uniref:hypothetical protein n=1 Tax=Nitrosophilus kaiyonis TaxID=2930200 RepID=UPI0024913E80|nr:hypothetical protein [Nitrosophilus kaiyonis]